MQQWPLFHNTAVPGCVPERNDDGRFACAAHVHVLHMCAIHRILICVFKMSSPIQPLSVNHCFVEMGSTMQALSATHS